MKFLPLRLIIAAALTAPVSLWANSLYTNEVLSLNPLGYWRFDGNLADSGQGNSGVDANPSSAVSFTATGGGAPIDPLGQAAVLNSSRSQSVSVAAGNVFSFSALQSFTLMAWVKTANQGLSAMPVLGKVDSSQTGYLMVIDNGGAGAPLGGGRFGLILESHGFTSVVESVVPVNDGAWHFLVATFDGSGLESGVQLYIDGVKVATVASGNATITGSIVNSAALDIGGTPAVASAPPYEGLIDEAAVWNSVLTQTQIQHLAGFAAGARKILPQFAFGGGWYSALYFSNTGIAPVSFPVTFTADNGTSLNVPLIGPATTVTLAPGESTRLEAPNVGTPISQGYVSVVPPPGVIGYGVFRQSLLGQPDQEAVVPFSSASTTSSTLLWDDTDARVTAFAIANPNPFGMTVTITVTKSDGSLVGTANVSLQPNNHTALLLRDPSLNLNGVVGNRGTAVFSTAAGNLAVLGLRANGIALTSIPTADK
ncbi:MAG TPA: LamG domain-containing protein [Bryobacteraceae bacterium]|jgi:hypothetical protein|nr:LamG domain-containing protein [Bryobacteraceae bacterium]